MADATGPTDRLRRGSRIGIKEGQKRMHVAAESYHPWHRLSEPVQCPDCETVFIVTKDFPKEQFLATLKQHHHNGQEHPDFVASAPAWTSISGCDCCIQSAPIDVSASYKLSPVISRPGVGVAPRQRFLCLLDRLEEFHTLHACDVRHSAISGGGVILQLH